MSDTMPHETPESLATDIMKAALDEVLARVPSLAAIRSIVMLLPQEGARLTTDGTSVRYDPTTVTSAFRETRTLPSRAVAHLLVHCVLLHPFPQEGVTRDAYSLAADIAAERVVSELFGMDNNERGQTQRAILEQITEDLGEPPTMVGVYDALYQGRWKDRATSWAAAFRVCDHDTWFDNPASLAGSTSDAQGGRTLTEAADGAPHEKHQGRKAHTGHPSTPERLAAHTHLESLAQHVATELCGTTGHGGAGSLVAEIGTVSHHDLDLRRFLMRFCRLRVTARPTDAEIDPVFYTYGLSLFGNLPLIEPLEEHADTTLSTLIIALDTSASVAGNTLGTFCSVAFDLIRATQGLASVEVRIIQADAKVQDDTPILNAGDLARWQRNVQVSGFGGTDFRPVFAHVDKLLRTGAIHAIDGLIYLTDGAGVYPSHAPTYPVAFVLTDDAALAQVPSWAYRTTTTVREIMSLARTIPPTSRKTP